MAKVVVQAGYMSGDMFGTAAALRLQSDLYVLVVHGDTDAASAKKMVEFYLSSVKDFSRDRGDGRGNLVGVPALDRSALPASPRVKLLRVADSRTFYKSMHDKDHADKGANMAIVRGQFRGVSFAKVDAMGETTRLVKWHFGNDEAVTRRALVQQWEIHDFDELAIQRFLNRNGVIHGKKYAFLWIRLSGKNGGAHTELDSSRYGWQQIINALPPEITPVIIGDKFNKPLTYAHGKLIDLTQFWQEMPFSLYKHPDFVGAEARLAQFTLFDYMVRAEYKVGHLGMRSGVLESAALMGAKVTYMEEVGNPQQKRIKELSESMDNYDRLELSQLPTRRGKLIDANQKEEWAKLYGPVLRPLAKRCDEVVKVIAQRVSAVEASVAPGAPFAQYRDRFITLSQPVWALKYGNSINNWATYKANNRIWTNGLESDLTNLYNDTYNKQGFAKGFIASDLTNVVAKIRTMVA